jgi:hypothetical protein
MTVNTVKIIVNVLLTVLQMALAIFHVWLVTTVAAWGGIFVTGIMLGCLWFLSMHWNEVKYLFYYAYYKYNCWRINRAFKKACKKNCAEDHIMEQEDHIK